MTFPAPPAGWYNDPSGEATLRWWNGVEWTENTHTDERLVDAMRNVTTRQVTNELAGATAATVLLGPWGGAGWLAGGAVGHAWKNRRGALPTHAVRDPQEAARDQMHQWIDTAREALETDDLDLREMALKSIDEINAAVPGQVNDLRWTRILHDEMIRYREDKG